jgi:malate dehydrogenase
MKVAVLGAAGGIGQPLSLLLKLTLPAGSELNLYDVSPVTPGVAVDLSHIPSAVAVKGYGSDGLADCLSGADVVVIPAGVPRKPGMTRDDLFNVNAGIVRTLIEGVAKSCPKALVAIITNPVNTTVPIAAEVLKKAGCYDPAKLLGVTMLDVIRAQTFVAEAKGLDPATIRVPVIGGHSGNTILPLLSQVKGASFGSDEVTALTTRIQEAGTEVVNAKAGGGSATLSMAEAAARCVLTCVHGLMGKSDQMTFAYVQGGGDDAEFFAQEVVVGKAGVEKVLPYGTLSAHEQSLKDGMLQTLKENIEAGVNFVRG